MAEGRMLKKKISLNEAVADLSNDSHRMLFTWGISHLDVEGRITGSPRGFKAMVVPLLEHITSEVVLAFFNDAEFRGLIQRYEVDGEWHVQYPKFRANQKLTESKEAASKRPPPPKSCQEVSEDSVSNQRELDEDSLRTQPEVKLSKENLNEGKIDAPSGSENSRGEDFETWWKEFPTRRRKGKPIALTKWKYLKNSGKLLPLSEMLAVLKAQKESPDWAKNGGEYIPGPLPYLNQMQFIDDSIQPQAQSTKPTRKPDCPRCHGSGLYQSETKPDGSQAMSECKCSEVTHGSA